MSLILPLKLINVLIPNSGSTFIKPCIKGRCDGVTAFNKSGIVVCCSATFKAFGINDASAMIDKISESELFKGKVTDEQLKNVVTFVATISPELAMKAWDLLTKSNGDALARAWNMEVAEGQTFGNFLAELAGQPQKEENEG